MTRGDLVIRQEQRRRLLHAFQFHADSKHLSSADRYFAVVMAEQEQENIDDLRALIEFAGRAK
jgi:hypothetical protein